MQIINFPDRPKRVTLEEVVQQVGASSVTIHYRPDAGYLVGVNFDHKPSAIGTGETFQLAMRHAREQCK